MEPAEDDDVTIERTAFDRLQALAKMGQLAELKALKAAPKAKPMPPEMVAAAKGYVRKLSADQQRALVLRRKRAKAARKANRGSR